MSGDLLWDNVSFLSGFEATPGTTNYVDESSNAHAITAPFGSANADDTVFKFGTTSAHFNASNDILRCARDTAFDLGSGDFTIDGWIRQDSLSATERVICGVWRGFAGTIGWLVFLTNNRLDFRYFDGTTNNLISATLTGFAANTWYHFAVERQGSTLRMYWDGDYVGGGAISGTISFPNEPFTIGNSNTASGGLFGRLDELRVTKGAARYTTEGSYTVPSDPFPRGPLVPDNISGAEATTVTLSCFLKMDLPERSILLSDGGQLAYNSEVYREHDDEFGAVATFGSIEAGFGDISEAADLEFAIPGDVAESLWWRDDLFDARARVWLGEVDSDGYTVTTATLLADLLVDTYERRQGPNGQDILAFELMGRAERLFLTNQGNVCSQRFHQSIWAGEKGFNNCTDLVGYTAWGAASPPRNSSGGGSTSPGINVQLY